ncbi:Uncharacterised protein [Mycobacteroides abscessus subsp. abscessus]|nr:Uncharacterised protein [Mycobacteroides abscessus subsp. abscessus]
MQRGLLRDERQPQTQPTRLGAGAAFESSEHPLPVCLG